MTDLSKIYRISDDVVARVIEGELIIVPIATGVGDLEDELYTLNPTGRAIWDKIDGLRSLGDIVKLLAGEYQTPKPELAADCDGLIQELLKRRIVLERKS